MLKKLVAIGNKFWLIVIAFHFSSFKTGIFHFKFEVKQYAKN